MRVWLLVDTVLVLLSGFQLFVLTERTNTAFAWTIASPLTAAFLGAGYWAALLLVFGSSRQTRWSDARLAVFGVLVFTTLTTVATLLHLDKFHLAASNLGPRVAAWGWLGVYVFVPPVLLVLLILQLRVPGHDPPRMLRLPVFIRVILALQGAILLILGTTMFAQPAVPSWPWALTPLTGRAIAAWLVGIGVIAVQVVWENDWRRVRVAMGSFTLLAVLELVALARYGKSVDWTQPAAAAYLFFLLVMAGVGAYLLTSMRGASSRAGATSSA